MSANMLNTSGKAAKMSEADRVRAALTEVSRRAALPPEAGKSIAPAPARGGFVLGPIDHRDPAPEYATTAQGHARVRPIRCADVFDVMSAQAQRRKAPPPLSPGQVGMARRYRDLVEALAADGCKLSCLDRATGAGGTSDWMDRRLQVSQEVEALRSRVGNAAALAARRVGVATPASAARRTIRMRYLVDAMALHDRTIDKVLRSHGWPVNGRNRIALSEALCGALDRMIGYRSEKSA